MLRGNPEHRGEEEKGNGEMKKRGTEGMGGEKEEKERGRRRKGERRGGKGKERKGKGKRRGGKRRPLAPREIRLVWIALSYSFLLKIKVI